MEWFPIPLARYCCRTILLKWRVCQIGTLIFMSEWWVSCKQRMTWQKHVAFHSSDFFWPRRKTNPSSASSHLIWQLHIRKPPIFRSTAVLKRNGGSCGIPKTPKNHLETPGTQRKHPLKRRVARWFHCPFRGQIGCLLPSGSGALCFERRSLWDGSGDCCGMWHAVIGKNWYIWYYLILFDQMEIDDALAVKFWLFKEIYILFLVEISNQHFKWNFMVVSNCYPWSGFYWGSELSQLSQLSIKKEVAVSVRLTPDKIKPEELCTINPMINCYTGREFEQVTWWRIDSSTRGLWRKRIVWRMFEELHERKRQLASGCKWL